MVPYSGPGVLLSQVTLTGERVFVSLCIIEWAYKRVLCILVAHTIIAQLTEGSGFQDRLRHPENYVFLGDFSVRVIPIGNLAEIWHVALGRRAKFACKSPARLPFGKAEILNTRCVVKTDLWVDDTPVS